MNPMSSILHNPRRSLSTPLLYQSTSPSDSDLENSPISESGQLNYQLSCSTNSLISSGSKSIKLLDTLSGHVGSVSCLALCGEFVLSASQGKDIIVWQQPDLRQFTKFGTGEGSVKALVTVGNKVFTAHQDSRIRVWKVSRSSENVFRLIDTLPTTKDYLGRCMKQSNYVEIRRHHKKLWIEHADSISCLAVSNGLIYSGSWDKTMKVWSMKDLSCLESIKAHDDAINGLVVAHGEVYSASADGKIKVWGKEGGRKGNSPHRLRGILEGHKDVSINAVIVYEGNGNGTGNGTGNGRVVFGGGSDGFLMGWEREEEKGNDDDQIMGWKLVVEVKAHQMAVLCLCFMGEILCSGSADRSICLWKREEGHGNGNGFSKVGVIRGHQGPVKCLQASPTCVGGGFLVYSGSLDKNLKVWWIPKEIKDSEELRCSIY